MATSTSRSATHRGARFEDDVGLAGATPLQVPGGADARQAGADDQHVEAGVKGRRGMEGVGHGGSHTGTRNDNVYCHILIDNIL